MSLPLSLPALLLLCGFSVMRLTSALTSSCPTEFLNLPAQWNTMQQQKACRDIFLAVVASDAVYNKNVEQFLQKDSRPEAALLKPVKSLEGAAQIFEVTTSNTVIVAFRGTDNLTDVWTDMQYYQTSVLPVDVHSGFYHQTLHVKLDELIEHLAQGKRILVCGHSLGGAAAKVLTLRLLNEGRLAAQYRTSQRVQCITFGAALAAGSLPGYDSSIFLNLVNENDLIPKLLLLKAESLDRLRGAFATTGLWSMLEGLAEQAYSTAPWYVQLAATFGQGFIDAYWNSESETFPYTPFGYFIFLAADGDSHKVRLASGSSEDVKRILRTPEALKILSSFWQALKDHRIANYAEALERIRMKNLPSCESSSDLDEMSCRTRYHFESSSQSSVSENFFTGVQVVGFGNLVSFAKSGMVLNLTTLDWLARLEGPFYSIVCAGQGRSGKSRILSLIAGSEGLFPSSDAAQPVTEGLDLAVIHVNGAHVLLFDAEGGDNALAKFHAVVNVMGLLLGQILVWVTGGTIAESAINLLGQMIASSDLIDFHGHQQKSLLFFVANKCTLRLTASDFQESLATFGDESSCTQPRRVIQDRFPLTNRKFFRLPLLQDDKFAEEFARLLHGIGDGLEGISALSLEALNLDGHGVATFIQNIFDNVRDVGNVDMPSVVESVILNGYLLPQARHSVKVFTGQLPQLSPHGTCIGNASVHDSREQVLDTYANSALAKLSNHAGMIADAKFWLKKELERVWTSWEANNTIAERDAHSKLSDAAEKLAHQFEDALSVDSSDYRSNLHDYDNRDWILQQYDTSLRAYASCLGSEIWDSRLKLSKRLNSIWKSVGDVNQALGKQLLEEEQEERNVFVEEYSVLCGCRRRRRHYKPKKTFQRQKRVKYTYQDGTTSHSPFDEGTPVHEYPHGDCGNHPESRR